MNNRIKQRTVAKTIKSLDRTVNLSKRMKDSFVRTKQYAEETREPRSDAPTDYAVDNIQEKSQAVARETVYRLPNPRRKASNNIRRAKSHFQEVKHQLPKGRRHAAEQAQKTAHEAKSGADRMRKTANQAKKTADEAKKATGDAKRSLKQIRYEGRQSLIEAKQSARFERNTTITNSNSVPELKTPRSSAPDISGDTVRSHGGEASPHVPSASGTKPPGAHITDIPDSGLSRPNYMNKGVHAPKRAADAVKSTEKSVKQAKTAVKGFKRTAKGTIKTARRTVKTAERTARQAVKTAQRTAKAAQKSAQVAAKAAKAAEKAAHAAAKAAAATAKAVTKAVIALVKAAVAAIKGLISAIAAGGWVAVLVILVICLVGLLVGSIFGIFFSGEPDPGTGQTINSVIADINTEYTGVINAIIYGNPHDQLDMSGARAAWKQVLAVYTVRTVSDPDNPMEVATMTDEKAAILWAVFWEMNTVSYALDTVESEVDVLDGDGLPTGETETVTTTVLRIIVSNKTAFEMASQYGLGAEQSEWLAELLKPEHNSLWNALLYGISSVGDGSMIEIADTQIGNVGGEPYWSWYGYSERVEWCACFVSWCAKLSGHIDTGIIPLFSYCPTGAQWFIDRDQWRDNTYTPSPGDIAFFDWEPDGEANHVGIVESVVNGIVNTIEGNSSDSVRRRSYEIGSIKIFGYGIPLYNG